MRNNQLWHMVSTQKTTIQSDLSSLRYEHKRDGLVCAKPNCHVLANISVQDDPFEFLSFAFKLCALSGSSAYRQPCDFNLFIFTL